MRTLTIGGKAQGARMISRRASMKQWKLEKIGTQKIIFTRNGGAWTPFRAWYDDASDSFFIAQVEQKGYVKYERKQRKCSSK